MSASVRLLPDHRDGTPGCNSCNPLRRKLFRRKRRFEDPFHAQSTRLRDSQRMIGLHLHLPDMGKSSDECGDRIQFLRGVVPAGNQRTAQMKFRARTVQRMETSYKLPHIGWNSLSFPNPSPLFRGLNEGAWVYFVHSFSGRAANPSQVIATTDYGMEVVAAVQNGNFFGTQFHPEKSGDVGLEILKNFGAMNP